MNVESSMTDQDVSSTAMSNQGTGAGALLRKVREDQGLSISALSNSLKVSVAKLEALEADRWDELTDPAFARALALTIARRLSLDVHQILPLLPQTDPSKHLHSVDQGINRAIPPSRPANDPQANSSGRKDESLRWALRIALFIIFISALIWAWPWIAGAGQHVMAEWMPNSQKSSSLPNGSVESSDSSASSLGVVVENVSDSAVIVPIEEEASGALIPVATAASDVLASAASSPLSASASVSLPTVTETSLSVSSTASVWVEVRDARGKVLKSGMLQPEQGWDLPASTSPLRVKLGDPSVVKLTYKNQPVDLSAYPAGRVARLTLTQ